MGARVQLALNVSDLESSVAFYSRLFGVEPHKRRSGYANFEIAEPPLKLVLLETTDEIRGTGTQGALNHLGVEVDSTTQVSETLAGMRSTGLEVVEEFATTCCYAVQDKGWVHDPAGTPWEVYTVTDDNPAVADVSGAGCCTQHKAEGSAATDTAEASAVRTSLPVLSCC